MKKSLAPPGYFTAPSVSSFPHENSDINGGHLDFSHLTELKTTYITEMYMKKQYKSTIKNHKIKKKRIFLMVFP